MDLQQNPVNEILYISFNQDYTCFVCGTETGFRVYSTDPFRLTYRRDLDGGGGLGVIAMLFRTNILAFAGGGRSPRFQPHKLVLWDDRQARAIAELSFRASVKSVRLRRDLVVVAVEKKVYVYGLRSLSLLDSIETIHNPKGLCCLSVGVERAVLVCPGMQKGKALVVFYPRDFGDSQNSQRERTTIIGAHESVIAAIATDSGGSLLATASDKGTIVRIYETATGAKLQELRRGADRAEIHSLVFSPGGDFLALASDKGTVHIFAIHHGEQVASVAADTRSMALPGSSRSPGPGGYSVVSEPGATHSLASLDSGPPANQKSSLQRLTRILPAYFASEWSLAQYRVPDFRCTAAFGADPHTVVIVCANGSYYKVRFDPVRGGEMVREEFAQFDDATAEANRAAGGMADVPSIQAPTASVATSLPAVASVASADTSLNQTPPHPATTATPDSPHASSIEEVAGTYAGETSEPALAVRTEISADPA